ncbi:MAG: hypothetical protein IV100_18865 [Myxococcales bacterium]|nr:hypothetical protein [Myxococcales bacterium]
MFACSRDDVIACPDSLLAISHSDAAASGDWLSDTDLSPHDVADCSGGDRQCAEVVFSDRVLDSGGIDVGGHDATDAGLRIVAPMIRVGEFGRFRLERDSGQPTPVAVEWGTDIPERLGILVGSGLARARAPGIVSVTARHEEGVTALMVEVAEIEGSGSELLSVSPMNVGAAAAQGLLHYDGTTFTSYNSGDRGPCVAALDEQFHITREACSAPLGWPGAHVGSIASIGQGLMLPYMHLVGQPLTGLRVIDRETFDVTAWYDTSERYPYLDAIDVADGHLWLDVYEVFVRVPLSGPAADTPDFDAAVVFRRSVSGTLQGLRVRDGRLWAMTESTTTHASLMGLHAYDLASLEPESKVDFAATLNSPTRVWRFGYPTAEPDHEGFDFDPGATAHISFPVIPTNEVHRLALAGQ